MRRDYSQFTARRAEVLVVGPDPANAFRHHWLREGMPFPGLADADHAVANRYGQEVSWLRLGRQPALLVIDMAGRIRYHQQGRWMSQIPANQELLAVLDGLNAPDTGGD